MRKDRLEVLNARAAAATIVADVFSTDYFHSMKGPGESISISHRGKYRRPLSLSRAEFEEKLAESLSRLQFVQLPSVKETAHA